MTPEQKEEKSRKIGESWARDPGRRVKAAATMKKHLHDDFTPVQKSERARKGALNKTTEQKAARAAVARTGRKRKVSES